MPKLYVVATPIGNLEDITLRALRTLKEVGLIAAEDTRKTKFLLAKYGITTPLTSYYEHNKLTKLDALLKLLETQDIALVSSAGVPGISDPGYELVKTALKFNIKVVPIPGVSAITTALAVSGLPTDSFHFIGFLPPRQAARRRILLNYADDTSTMIVLEAPHRCVETLEDMLEIWGDRPIAIARELTKIHEEIFRGSIQDALAHFKMPRGEFTMIIGGQIKKLACQPDIGIETQMLELRNSGVPAKTAVKSLAEATGLSRKELYRAWLKQNKAK